MIELSFDAAGVNLTAREAFTVLGQIAPELAAEARRDMIAAAQPAIASIRRFIPKLPMRGWDHKGRTSWTTRDPASAVRADFRKSGRVSGDTFPLLTLVQPTPAGAIYDLAATPSAGGKDRTGRRRNPEQNRYFIANLNQWAVGQPRSRSMWPGTLQALPEIEAALRQTVARIEQTLNKELG